jgi:hypothetical protein
MQCRPPATQTCDVAALAQDSLDLATPRDWGQVELAAPADGEVWRGDLDRCRSSRSC